eukprot:GHVU01100349.1.p1 GENE.GHVU01100349.1~~GHVU01100349.1.p1  ORF type:complete len:401 (+),score=81.97 GHVU01100349.1:406-1608(+)
MDLEEAVCVDWLQAIDLLYGGSEADQEDSPDADPRTPDFCTAGAFQAAAELLRQSVDPAELDVSERGLFASDLLIDSKALQLRSLQGPQAQSFLDTQLLIALGLDDAPAAPPSQRGNSKKALEQVAVAADRDRRRWAGVHGHSSYNHHQSLAMGTEGGAGGALRGVDEDILTSGSAAPIPAVWRVKPGSFLDPNSSLSLDPHRSDAAAAVAPTSTGRSQTITTFHRSHNAAPVGNPPTWSSRSTRPTPATVEPPSEQPNNLFRSGMDILSHMANKGNAAAASTLQAVSAQREQRSSSATGPPPSGGLSAALRRAGGGEQQYQHRPGKGGGGGGPEESTSRVPPEFEHLIQGDVSEDIVEWVLSMKLDATEQITEENIAGLRETKKLLRSVRMRTGPRQGR